MGIKVRTQQRLEGQTRPLTRRSERHQAWSEVVIQSLQGGRARARLNDVSPHGCNVICDADWLRAGGFVAITINPERSIQAIVRWIRDGSCGVEFLRPIPDAEATSLASQWG